MRVIIVPSGHYDTECVHTDDLKVSVVFRLQSLNFIPWDGGEHFLDLDVGYREVKASSFIGAYIPAARSVMECKGCLPNICSSFSEASSNTNTMVMAGMQGSQHINISIEFLITKCINNT